MIQGMIIASIIMSILTMSSSGQVALLLDIAEEKEQNVSMFEIKKAAKVMYDAEGYISPDKVLLNAYADVDILSLQDNSKTDFEVLNNAGVPFTYNGVSYLAVIVAPYSDGLDSEIVSDVFEPRNSEDFLLVSVNELNAGIRGETLKKIVFCNTAVTNYQSVEGILPTNVQQLMTLDYIAPIDSMDGFGHNLLISSGGQCYSSGIDNTDNNMSGDDIF